MSGPQGGQWWGKDDDPSQRVFIIGMDPDGQLVWLDSEYGDFEYGDFESGRLDWSGWHRLYGCTGWDWEEGDETTQEVVESEEEKPLTLDEIIRKFPCKEGYVYQRWCPARDGIDEINFYYKFNRTISGWILYQHGSMDFYTGLEISDGHCVTLVRCKVDQIPVVPQKIE